jgi:hypothetical protein
MTLSRTLAATLTLSTCLAYAAAPERTVKPSSL